MKKVLTTILVLLVAGVTACAEFTANDEPSEGGISLRTTAGGYVSSFLNNDVCLSLAKNANSTQAPGGYTLFFSSDRVGGIYDIYVAHMLADELFSEPVPLEGLSGGPERNHLATTSLGGVPWVFYSEGATNSIFYKSLSGVPHSLGLQGIVMGILPQDANLPTVTVDSDQIGLVIAPQGNPRQLEVYLIATNTIAAGTASAGSAAATVTLGGTVTVGGGAWVPGRVLGSSFRDSFVYSRLDDNGKLSFYISDLSDNGERLLSDFDSPGDDASPFYHQGDGKLYFTSNYYYKSIIGDNFNLYRWNQKRLEMVSGTAAAKSTSTWAYNYGGSGIDAGSAILQLGDGSYLMAGRTDSGGHGFTDALLMKLNVYGEVEWSKAYGSWGFEAANAACLASDGHYIVAGRTTSIGQETDGFVMKVSSSDGSILWQRTIGGANYDELHDVKFVTNIASILAAGRTSSGGTTGYDGWVVRLSNDNGTIVNNYTYSSAGYDAFYRIARAGNESWVVGRQENGSDNNALLVLVDNITLEPSVSRILPNSGSAFENAWGAIATTGGDLYLAGRTEAGGAGGSDILVAHIYNDGSRDWVKAFGGSSEDQGYSISLVGTTNLIVAGTSTSLGIGGQDIVVLRMDNNGTLLWQKGYGFSGGDDQLPYVTPTTNGGFVLSGQTEAVANNDVLAIKLNAQGFPRYVGNGYELGKYGTLQILSPSMDTSSVTLTAAAFSSPAISTSTFGVLDVGLSTTVRFQ